jgi:epoxyqueuosine reductase QueG
MSVNLLLNYVHLMNLISRNTQIIKQLTSEAGFDFCGISKAEFLEDEARNLENWLNKNYHGKMAYMANYFDKPKASGRRSQISDYGYS